MLIIIKGAKIIMKKSNNIFTIQDMCIDLLFNRDLKYTVIDNENYTEYLSLIKSLQKDKRLTKHIIMDKIISITQYPDREAYVLCDLHY